MNFGKEPSFQDKVATFEGRYGKTTGVSKGKAPVSAKPKVKARPTGGFPPDGFKATATWKF